MWRSPSLTRLSHKNQQVSENAAVHVFMGAPHLCSGGWAGCQQAEGSCRIGPGGWAAPRGLCSWSSFGTQPPGDSGRPCGSSPRRLPPGRQHGPERKGAGRGSGRGGEDGNVERAAGGRVVERGSEIEEPKRGWGVERDGEGEIEVGPQTDTSG